MCLARRTKKYTKSIARLQLSGRINDKVFINIENLIDLLSSGEKLDPRYRDHALWGEYVGHRECHIQGDLLLVYKIEKDLLILILADIGSHSHLFG